MCIPYANSGIDNPSILGSVPRHSVAIAAYNLSFRTYKAAATGVIRGRGCFLYLG